MENTTIKQNEDYYIDDNGMLVMTEAFLKRRGFCCGNGCRHCPYTKTSSKSVTGTTGR